MKILKFFKLLKVGYKMAKSVKKEKKPIFGEDDSAYGVLTDEEKYHLSKGITQNLEASSLFPKDGGSFTNIKGEDYPFPGIPNKDTVLDIANVKRLIPAAIEGYYPFVGKHILAPDKYCRCVREVYRLFGILISREKNNKHIRRWEMVRDMVCLALEYDNAYRFRLQDMVKEANLDELGFSEGDKYWAEKTSSYKWGFLLDKKPAKDMIGEPDVSARGEKHNCSFCDDLTDLKGDGRGLRLCQRCAKLQADVWGKITSN